jgi:hypothetical protein
MAGGAVRYRKTIEVDVTQADVIGAVAIVALLVLLTGKLLQKL